MSGRTPSFARNVLWQWTGLGVAIAGAFVLSPYMIRKLGDEGYGLWALVFSVVEYFGVLDLGFRSATVKYCAHHRTLGETEKVNEIVNTSLLYFLLVAAAVVGLTFGLAPFADRVFVVSPSRARTFYWLIVLMGCSFAMSMVGSVFQAGLEGFSRFDVAGRVASGMSAVRIAGSFAVLAAGGGLLGLGLFVAATQVAVHLLNLVMFRRVFSGLRLSPGSISKATLRQLAAYGVHTMTAGGATQLLNQTPPLLIGHFRSAVAVGHFNIPVRLMQATGVEITARVAVVTGSRAAELCARRDYEGIGRLGVLTNRYCLALFMPLAIFFVAYGRQFLNVWIGPAWGAAAGPLLVPFVLGTALGVSAQFNTSAILYGLAAHRLYARGLLAEAILCAAGLAVVLPRYGIQGAAWTAAVLMILNRGAFVPWVLCRVIGWKWRRYVGAIVLRPVLAAAPACVAAWLLPGRNWGELIAAGVCVTAVYAGAAFFVCVDPEHRVSFLRTLRRGFGRDRRPACL